MLRELEEAVTDSRVLRGLGYLKIDGVFSQSMTVLISNSFVIPMLLLLGANSFVVGLYSGIITVSALAQLVSPYFVKFFGSRKKVSVVFSFLSRFVLFVSSILLVFGFSLSLFSFLLLFSLFYFLSNVSSGSFKFWMLDFVPRGIRGRFFAVRMMVSLIVAMFIGLLVALYIEFFTNGSLVSYDVPIFLASLLGLVGLLFLARIPEPALSPLRSVDFSSIQRILRNGDIKRHLLAIFSVYFALNLSFPFFVYYLLVNLGFNLVSVFFLSALSQFSTIVFLPIWGKLIDSYGAKATLKFAVKIIALSLLIWPFTTLPYRHFFSVFLIGVFYFLIGVSVGGLNLASGLIAYYLVRGDGDQLVLSLNDVFVSIGSFSGSFVGALLSIPFGFLELSLTLNVDFSRILTFYIIDLKGLDFLFVLSSVLALSFLSLFSKYKVDVNLDEEKNYYEIVYGFKRAVRTFRSQITLIFNGKSKASRSRRIENVQSSR